MISQYAYSLNDYMFLFFVPLIYKNKKAEIEKSPLLDNLHKIGKNLKILYRKFTKISYNFLINIT